MKFCVIGVGRFGYQVATTLAHNGMDVLAIDSNEALVSSIKDKVAQAICMNASDADALRSVGVEEMDVVIVCMGENFAQSILITALLKRNFSIPRVISRSVDQIHKDILLLIGADEVVMPEQEMGSRLADTLSLPFNALMRLTPTFSLSYRKAPSLCVGKPLSCLHKMYGIVCIGKRIKDSIEPLGHEYIIKEHDILVYAGPNTQLEDLARV
jgi:trk system potassium uptake protein TrkA